MTGIGGNLTQRSFKGLQQNVDAELHVAVQLQFFQRVDALEQGNSAAGDDSLFDRRLGGVHGIFHSGFLLFQFGFGGGADADYSHTAG